MKLLIAEDDLTSQILLEKLTRQWGYEPIIAEDGEKAWQILKQENAPKLLLIDWEMPRLNGIALCQRIRRQDNENPPYIILLTSRNTVSDIVVGLDVGANDYITKPFDSIELCARVQVGQRMLGLQQELIQAKEKLLYQANHDGLTGLLNRKAIIETLNVELARAIRQQLPLCIALIDIDLFKQINDNYGHLAGDIVLREVTDLISSELRPYDFAGRYGGEEFLLVLNASESMAAKLLDRIRQLIQDTIFRYAQNNIEITISTGYAIFEPVNDLRDDQALIDAADKALYSAKENGRNKVICLK